MDVDDQAIRWLKANHPEIDARVNPFAPPAPFESATFDLLCSISIFTHLSPASQRAWLAEVARLLQPGGLAVLTTLGPKLRETWAAGHRAGITARQIELLRSSPPLDEVGNLFVPEEQSFWNSWRFRGVGPDYGLAFWDHRHIEDVWSEWFDVLDIFPAAMNWQQDAVVVTPKLR